MYQYIIWIILIGVVLYLGKTSYKEHFESTESIEYIRIHSKLNDKTLQLYKGSIDTSLTLNSKKGNDYEPQLWINEGGKIKSVFNSKYITISNDGSKVVLEPLDSKKKQTWIIDSNGYITNGDMALHIEGDNTSEDALVVVAKKGEGKSFQWYTEKVSVSIVKNMLSKGITQGKQERNLGNVIKSNRTNCTYTFWFRSRGMNYKKGEWKNIFNRGNKDMSERGPGMWITPSEQKFHIRCDTTNTKNEGIGATKFTFEPDRWYYLGLVYSDKELKFYVDGQVSETFTFKGTPVHGGDFFLSLAGGFDGELANVEYTNKSLSPTDITKQLKQTNPEKTCKEDRATTTLPNNLVKSIDEWTNEAVSSYRKNEECPPNKLGGNTISFTPKEGSKLYTSLELLENQYYDISIWAYSDSATIRPYAGSWSGEWKHVTKEKGWKQFRWEFLHTDKAKQVGFEINSSSNSSTNRCTLFLPAVSIKVLQVSSGNVEVKEFRSNGTHPTCSVKEVGLNAIQGWCALKDKRDEYYLEADFDKLYQIQKVHTRGRGDDPQWTTEYRIEYFDIYHNKWRQYGGRLEGNRDMNTVKTNDVDILTNKIRIYPVSFQSWPSMRVSFSGSVGLKDKCQDYKVKSETMMNILERERYLKLYNRECKKISYYEYEMALEKDKETINQLKMKVHKSEIDAKTYETKYREIMDRMEEAERKYKREKNTGNTEEIIEGNNRTMTDQKKTSKPKLDEKCQPISDEKEESKKGKGKVSNDVKDKVKQDGMTDHQLLQKLVEGMDKINKDLSDKEKKLVDIQNELKGLESGSPKKEKKPEKKQKLEKKKLTTEQEIKELQNQLQICQANFSAGNVVIKDIKEGFESGSEDKIIITDVENLSPYDIRRHKQYKQLISDIQTKMQHEYKCEKKDNCPKCTLFNDMDIRKHKDYQRMVQYVFEIAKEQFGDIKKHADYKKLVKEVQRRTIQAYGRKTATGYVKCPTNCELLGELNIQEHPKFRALVRQIVQRTIAQYGEPIPGTDPVLYRKCSSKNNVNNSIDNNMSSEQCLQNFKIETFADGSEASALPKDQFDIRNHRQYAELMKQVIPKSKLDEVLRSKCTTSDQEKAELQKLRMKTAVIADVTQNDEYKKLVAAYKKCKVSSKNIDVTKDPKYLDLLKQLKDSIARSEMPAISSTDITRHPEINKYVLKSSLPIDLDVRKANSGELAKLKDELNKLQNLHSQCIHKFNIEKFDGGAVPRVECSPAQKVIHNINLLVNSLDSNMQTDNKMKYEEIKQACRKAMDVLGASNPTEVAWVKEVYADIGMIERGEKNLSDINKKYKISAPMLPANGPQKDIQKMVENQAKMESNQKKIVAEKQSLEASKKELVEQSKQMIEKPAAALAQVKPSDRPEEDAQYLRQLRKTLEGEKKMIDIQLKALESKYETAKQKISDYSFKNKYLADEIAVLRKRCNERILKLWNENQGIRSSVSSREEEARKRELKLESQQKALEEREQRVSESKSSNAEKYQYFQNKIQEERSVANRYKEELEKLRDNIESEKQNSDKIRLDMDGQIAKVRDECAGRVDRYRRMHEEGEKLLSELRTRSLQAPALVEKIDKVENKITKQVEQAVAKTQANVATVPEAPKQAAVTQTMIDSKLMEEMKKLVDKVDSIEKKLTEKVDGLEKNIKSGPKPEDLKWYNNQYAVLQ